MTELRKTGARFETTRWTLIEALRAGPGAEHDAALSSLVDRYWPAVYGFLRRSGVRREEAAEVTQAFFVEVVLTRELFSHASPAAGRLRALMMAALKRYLIDRHRRSAARRERDVISLGAFEGEEARLESLNGEEPEAAFNRSWAAGLLSEAVARCERHFSESGRAAHWNLFEARVLRPAVRGSGAPALAEEAARLGFRTSADGAAAVQTVKRRVSSVLSEVVAETVGRDEEVGEELAEIRAVLG